MLAFLPSKLPEALKMLTCIQERPFQISSGTLVMRLVFHGFLVPPTNYHNETMTAFFQSLSCVSFTSPPLIQQYIVGNVSSTINKS
jgi:hypothetical protein